MKTNDVRSFQNEKRENRGRGGGRGTRGGRTGRDSKDGRAARTRSPSPAGKQGKCWTCGSLDHLSWNPVCPNMSEGQKAIKNAQRSQISVAQLRELKELRAEKNTNLRRLGHGANDFEEGDEFYDSAQGDARAPAVGAVNFVECFGANSDWDILPVFCPSVRSFSCIYVAALKSSHAQNRNPFAYKNANNNVCTLNCVCSLCARFRDDQGAWLNISCQCRPGCKCSTCRTFFDENGK